MITNTKTKHQKSGNEEKSLIVSATDEGKGSEENKDSDEVKGSNEGGENDAKVRLWFLSHYYLQRLCIWPKC
jgi:hypothetical protein